MGRPVILVLLYILIKTLHSKGEQKMVGNERFPMGRYPPSPKIFILEEELIKFEPCKIL